MGERDDARLEESGFPPAKLLAVDDVDANLLVISAVLGPLGHEIVEAKSGAAALRLASREEFAVILLDVMMPEMDGFEMLEQLRQVSLAQHTPVILITAHDLSLELTERAYALGAIDCLSKPVAPSVLRGKVAALASLYRRGQEIRRQAAELAAKDRQIAILAHDLRNPLSAVSASAGLIIRKSMEEHTKVVAGRIARSTERMNTMVRNLMDFARLGTGTIQIAPTSMDMGDVCREVAEDFEVADSDRRIEVTSAGDAKGEWDRARIFQALSNLVGNAMRYGGGRATIHVERRGRDVEVAVHNDGPTIPAEIQPRIFEPFERGDADGAGLGLGLYIVSEIARAHRGDVAVTSSDRTGTTFSLRLPVGVRAVEEV